MDDSVWSSQLHPLLAVSPFLFTLCFHLYIYTQINCHPLLIAIWIITRAGSVAVTSAVKVDFCFISFALSTWVPTKWAVSEWQNKVCRCKVKFSIKHPSSVIQVKSQLCSRVNLLYQWHRFKPQKGPSTEWLCWITHLPSVTNIQHQKGSTLASAKVIQINWISSNLLSKRASSASPPLASYLWVPAVDEFFK